MGRSFKMFAFDGLHGTGSEVGVLGAGSVISIEPVEGITGSTFIQDGLTSFTTHELTCTSPVLVRLNSAVSVFPSSTPPLVRLAMVSSVTLLAPTTMFESGIQTTSKLIAEGTTLALTANALASVVEASPSSTGSVVTSGAPATSKSFPWVPMVIGFAALTGFIWWVAKG